ncbi:hypothetical protein STASHLEY_00910 [Brevundimonas phage vB_BpoS-StAshley]|nr:hypothetical protein STASHLEY_00910 [Brevundimonas phage vB_BpoS-StAshley]
MERDQYQCEQEAKKAKEAKREELLDSSLEALEALLTGRAKLQVHPDTQGVKTYRIVPNV